MFTRFTQPARRAVVLAQQEAFESNAPMVGAEHIMVGLALEPDTVAGTALGLSAGAVRDLVAGLPPGLATGRPLDGAALATLGIDLDQVRRSVEAQFGRGALSRAGTVRDRPYARFSAEAKQLLERALREARRRGDGYIGTEHLLLAGIGLPVGAAVLAAAGRTAVDVVAGVDSEVRRRRSA